MAKSAKALEQKEAAKSSNTVVKKCVNPKCKSTFQDEIYGFFMRVMNKISQGKKVEGAKHRCTVCDTIQ